MIIYFSSATATADKQQWYFQDRDTEKIEPNNSTFIICKTKLSGGGLVVLVSKLWDNCVTCRWFYSYHFMTKVPNKIYTKLGPIYKLIRNVTNVQILVLCINLNVQENCSDFLNIFLLINKINCFILKLILSWVITVQNIKGGNRYFLAQYHPKYIKKLYWHSVVVIMKTKPISTGISVIAV